MWRIILTISVFCWDSDAVTCRNNNNGEVDWYILYKAPNKQPLTGLEYLYIDSTGATKMVPSTPNYKSINHLNGVLANTLRPLFTPVRSMPPNFGFISYSDQPPGCRAFEEFGHSKGVVMVKKGGTGLWLLHSTPQFPFRRDQNTFWPQSGNKYAQTFICVTFPYDQFKNIGKHLQYIRAFPFEHDVPEDFHQELKDAANRVEIPPVSNFAVLVSAFNTEFRSIAKQQKEETKDGDLYFTIAQQVGSDLFVQTWGCQRDRARSYCGNQKVVNIKSITTGLGNWGPKGDHSKWCVAKNNHWTCFADVNRAPTQYLRRGGALCISNEAIHQRFTSFAGRSEDCTTQHIIDTMDVTDIACEPDPDTYMDPSVMG